MVIEIEIVVAEAVVGIADMVDGIVERTDTADIVASVICIEVGFFVVPSSTHNSVVHLP